MISKSKDLIRADRKKGIAGAVLAALALRDLRKFCVIDKV